MIARTIVVRVVGSTRASTATMRANQLRLWLAKRGRRIDYIFGMVSVNEALGIEILAGILALAFGERGWRVVLWLVCGAVLIEDLRRDLAVLDPGPDVEAGLLPKLVEKMRSGQGVFERTGGLHAAGLFDQQGALICMREDIGRHNAVDKVVGRMLLDRRLPLSGAILVVSGRAGYEIVQKAITAGIPLVAAVGAPSSLAVALAREFNQTLVGFLRGERYNVYSSPERLAG